MYLTSTSEVQYLKLGLYNDDDDDVDDDVDNNNDVVWYAN